MRIPLVITNWYKAERTMIIELSDIETERGITLMKHELSDLKNRLRLRLISLGIIKR